MTENDEKEPQRSATVTDVHELIATIVEFAKDQGVDPLHHSFKLDGVASRLGWPVEFTVRVAGLADAMEYTYVSAPSYRGDPHTMKMRQGGIDKVKQLTVDKALHGGSPRVGKRWPSFEDVPDEEVDRRLHELAEEAKGLHGFDGVTVAGTLKKAKIEEQALELALEKARRARRPVATRADRYRAGRRSMQVFEDFEPVEGTVDAAEVTKLTEVVTKLSKQIEEGKNDPQTVAKQQAAAEALEAIRIQGNYQLQVAYIQASATENAAKLAAAATDAAAKGAASAHSRGIWTASVIGGACAIIASLITAYCK